MIPKHTRQKYNKSIIGKIKLSEKLFGGPIIGKIGKFTAKAEKCVDDKEHSILKFEIETLENLTLYQMKSYSPQFANHIFTEQNPVFSDISFEYASPVLTLYEWSSSPEIPSKQILSGVIIEKIVVKRDDDILTMFLKCRTEYSAEKARSIGEILNINLGFIFEKTQNELDISKN